MKMLAKKMKGGMCHGDFSVDKNFALGFEK